MTIYANFISSLVFKVIAFGNSVVPKRRQLVMNAYPDIEDQLVAVLRWIAENEPDKHAVTVLVQGGQIESRAKLRQLIGDYVDHIKVLKKSGLSAIWAYWRSSHILFTHGMYDVRSVPKKQTIVNLWHGMPIKAIWRPLNGSSAPECTWLLSTSKKFSDVLADTSGLEADKIAVVGLPRNDLLFSRRLQTAAFASNVRAGANRVLLFLPTYRRSNAGFVTCDGQEMDNPLGMNPDEVMELKSLLRATQTRILVKPHPMSVHYGRDEQLNEFLWIISDSWLHKQGVTLYDALGHMDALITDVSSVYVDFLILRRPVIFYFPDLALYRQKRSFLLEPLEEWLAGPICTTIADLLRELINLCSNLDEYVDKRENLASVLNPQYQPDATRKLFSLLHGGDN